MDNRKKVEEIIIKVLEEATINDSKITTIEHDKPLEVYGVDSFVFISTVVELEKAFEVEIPDYYLSFDKMATINSIVECIDNLINK